MSAEPISRDIGYERAGSIEEARALLDEHGHEAKIVAGGQSLMLLLRHGLADPAMLIDISTIPELSRLEVRDNEIAVGSTVTYDGVESHPMSSRHGCIGDAIANIAGRQVRNMGTLGGAVSHADPSLDIVPPLLCLNARIRVGSVDGTRTVPLEDFHRGFMTSDLDENELVEQIFIDRSDARTGSGYETHAHIKSGWSTVGAGAAVTLSGDGDTFEEVRVALAAVGDSAIRGTSVESQLTGQSVSESVIEDAAEAVVEDVDPMDDISGSAAYKRDLSTVLTRRSLETAVERAGGML